MNLKLSNIHVGKIDGKNEFTEVNRVSETLFSELFTAPPRVRVADLDSRKKSFVVGLRGTGKTSFLRWYVNDHRSQNAVHTLVLFKSQVDEAKRVELSRQAGAHLTEVSPDKFEFAQDFKEAWRFFLHYQIGRLLSEKPEATEVADQHVDRYLGLLGFSPGGAIFDRILGYFPRLEGAKIKLNANLPLVKAELSGDIVMAGKEATVTLEALNRALERNLFSINFLKDIIVALDELEVFNLESATYERDLRMVRDLVFAIDDLNTKAKNNDTKAHFIAAVRTEVIDALGSIGQEVNRIIDDFGINISWYGERSSNHPLFDMIRKRLVASENYAGMAKRQSDILFDYFPSRVGGVSLEEYLLDGSFYKPRDIVARLQAAQEEFPDGNTFSEKALQDSYKTYSRKMWKEVELELSAYYKSSHIELIKRTFSGKSAYFDADEYRARAENIQSSSVEARAFFLNKGPDDLLADLYRLGVIGNEFFVQVGTGRRKRNRWVYRGDLSLHLDDRIVVSRALWGALSIAS